MDFKWKNGQLFQKFSEMTGKSGVASMEIIADGTQANENPAAAYRGLGCISANNASRLLLDYKVEHPKEYEEIMRLLFQKDYGIGLSHIKLELGADVNSSCGTEPATKRTPEERADVTRGAGFQFAADAKAINPDITLDLLRWGEPAWVSRAFTVSQEHGFNARYSWIKETLDAAYRVYGLKFHFISAEQNETDRIDESWILFLRYRLDHEVRAPYDYRKIKLVASDEVGTRNIAAQMVENASLRNAIDVIGLHYTTFGDSYTNLLNEAYGKEIWYSEGSAPCNLSELTVQADQSGLVGKNSAIDIANRIINSYYNGKMCMYEFRPAIAANYDGAYDEPKHLIAAQEPWSGFYRLDSGFWMAMHFSRFSPKGWLFVNGACYGDGEENHAIEHTSHNFMTLVSPDRSEMTMHFTNEDLFTRTYSVQLKDMGFTNRMLSTVITTGPNPGEAFDANWFRRGKPIKPSHRNGETYFIKVPPQSIMTITTLDTGWVNGVETFSHNIPNAERLPLPYQDHFRYQSDEIMVRGCAPRYMTDQGGAFELIHSDQDGDILCQRIKKGNIPANWRYRGTPEPITCLGDDRWRSYSAEIEVRLDNRDAENYAGFGIRYNSTVTCETTSRCGYTGILYGDGRWQLLDMDNVAAEGNSMTVRATDWNKLKLLILGDSIFFFLNGDLLTTYRPQSPVNSGRISICSDYEMNTFRNLQVTPLPILPLYVRRVDCFSEEIFYNDFWDICTTESYRFYHRTSMKAQPQAAFSCQFTGTGIAVIGTARNAEFEVVLDGEQLYETLFVPYSAPRQSCLTIDQLPNGTHTLQMTLKSGDFKLDVLEVPENFTMMPDILTVTSAAQAAAEEHALAEQQKALAKKQAAENIKKTLQQAVAALQPEKPAEEPKSETPAAVESETDAEKQPTFKEVLENSGVIGVISNNAAKKKEQLEQDGKTEADETPTVMEFPLPHQDFEAAASLTPVPEHAEESVKIEPLPETDSETSEEPVSTPAAEPESKPEAAAPTESESAVTAPVEPEQPAEPQQPEEPVLPTSESIPTPEEAPATETTTSEQPVSEPTAPETATESAAAPSTVTYIEEEWDDLPMPELPPQETASPAPQQPKPTAAPPKKPITPTPSPAPKMPPLHPPVLNDPMQSEPYRKDFNIDIDI